MVAPVLTEDSASFLARNPMNSGHRKPHKASRSARNRMTFAALILAQLWLVSVATAQQLSVQLLGQTVARKPDGGSLTLQQIKPPANLPVRVKQPEVVTPEEAAIRQRREGKESELISIGATVYADGMTLVRCLVDGQQGLQVLSNVDFRLLCGTGILETETKVYSLVMIAGHEPETPLPAVYAENTAHLPAAGVPGFVLLESKLSFTEAEQRAVDALTVLHNYVRDNHEVLVQNKAQQEAAQAAQELARRNAPPPPPRHTVLQFWKLPKQTASEGSSQSAGHSSGGGSGQP